MKKTLALIAIGLLLTGCFTSSRQLNKVHLGMSEAEVLKILGEPASRAESKDGSVKLFYSLCEGHTGNRVFASYSVNLVGGKVDAYGRDSGTVSTQAPAPVIIPAPVIAH